GYPELGVTRTSPTPANAPASTVSPPACGAPSPTPSARYTRRWSSWRTWPRSYAGASTGSTPTWPRSGTTRAGYAYAHPTSAPPTAVTGCSCSPHPAANFPAADPTDQPVGVRTLPTPCARDGKGPGHQYGLPDLVEPHGSKHDLSPTPTSGGGTGYMSGSNRDVWRPSLESAVR